MKKSLIISLLVFVTVIAGVVAWKVMAIMNVKTNSAGDIQPFGEVPVSQFNHFVNQWIDANMTKGEEATLRFLRHARDSFDHASGSNASISTYLAAWRLCLRRLQETNNKDEKKKLKAMWDICLMENDALTPFQVYALDDCWDRNFLDDSFWTLFEKTKKRKTLKALTYILYKHGNQGDIKRLEQNLDGELDAATQNVIQNAINWMNARLLWPDDEGPAAWPPRMEAWDQLDESLNSTDADLQQLLTATTETQISNVLVNCRQQNRMAQEYVLEICFDRFDDTNQRLPFDEALSRGNDFSTKRGRCSWFASRLAGIELPSLGEQATDNELRVFRKNVYEAFSGTTTPLRQSAHEKQMKEPLEKRLGLAQSDTTPLFVLAKLAEDSDANVRKAVASNRRSAAHLLYTLSTKDADMEVRDIARQAYESVAKRATMPPRLSPKRNPDTKDSKTLDK